MGTRRRDFSDDLDTEATRWIVRLDGERSPELVADHEAWLAQNVRHRVAYAKQSLAWKRMDILRRMRPLDRGKDADPDLLKPARRWPRVGGGLMAFTRLGWAPRAVVGVAASALLVFGAVFYFQPDAEASYSTRIGGLEKAVLDDGTSVSLNTDTRIRVRFTATRRQIFLDRGELVLSVAHDASRPLEVTAGNVTSRAVGTKFSVRLYEGDGARVETLVTEGRVLVLRQPRMLGIALTPRPITHTLSAGEGVVVNRGSAVVRTMSAKEVRRKLMWTTGTIMFEGEKLVDVVQELNRYNTRKLMILDPGISQTAVGGGFDTARANAYATDLMRFFGEKKLATVNSSPSSR